MAPILIAARELSGGRMAWVYSVRPGQRVTVVLDRLADDEATAEAIASAVIPVITRASRAREG